MLSPYELIAEFDPQPEELALIREIPFAEVPPPYHRLLVHEHHMTVSMETCHRSPIAVEVLEFHEHPLDMHPSSASVRDPSSKRDPEGPRVYCRKILLRKLTDRRVVQFGIVRLHVAYIDPRVMERIRAREEPLGRILIDENVFRSVVLERTWRIDPRLRLEAYFESPERGPTYGRTATIWVDERPAVELLEISAPLVAPD